MTKIAMLLGEEFEDSEFTVPCERLRAAGHEVTVIGEQRGATVHGKRAKTTALITATPADVDAESFDALVIPGGHSPDHLRMNREIVAFVRRFCETGKPVAAVCHGPQLLIEAGVVRGRTMTSWPSVKTDLENAGAHWVDQQVVEDGNLITSRKPDDLEAFSAAMLRRLEQARPARATA